MTMTLYPPAIGGAQTLMHYTARHLPPGIDVSVACHWDENRRDWLWGTTVGAPVEGRRYLVDGIPVERLAHPTRGRARQLPWVLGYFAWEGPAIRRLARDTAEALREPAAHADLIHNCRIGREPLTRASLDLARERNVPCVITAVHHPRWSGFLHRHYSAMYREADAVIALTEAERRVLVDRLGVRSDRAFVTGMGPILAPSAVGERFRSEHGLGRDPVVLFLAQKFAYKGMDQLLRALPAVWRTVPETRVVFLGPRTSYSEHLFRDVRDPRVLELGAVSLESKTDALDACDVFCLPSRQESFGAVFTEAWALRKPVIGADIPAVSEVIEDGGDGFTVTAEPDVLAERIVRLLGDPMLRRSMGEAGARKVESRFSWPRLSRLTADVYETVRARPRR
jgi:glycosyltransferase involved in cell wall biosynthesis